MIPRRFCAVVSFAALAWSAMSMRGAGNPREAEVSIAHKAFHDAWAKFDADTIAGMIADDFVWISRNGSLGDRDRMVDAFRNRRMTVN